MPRKPTKTTQKRKADRLFAQAIKQRDRFCQVCGGGERLQAAHLVSRRYHSTRWCMDNAVALCAGCHWRYTNDPLAWDRWCVERLGVDTFEALKTRALSPARPDYEVILGELAG